MTESLERHQEKLGEKQAACLEKIRELEKQVTRTTILAVKGLCSRELPVRRSGAGESPLTSGSQAGSHGTLGPFHVRQLCRSLLGWHPLS